MNPRRIISKESRFKQDWTQQKNEQGTESGLATIISDKVNIKGKRITSDKKL